MNRDKSILRINRLWPATKEALNLIDPEILPYLLDMAGGKRISVDTSAPSNPSIGDIWIDTSE